MKNRKVLVTGANGFLGYNLCKVLIYSGWRITALGRTPISNGPWDNFIKYDLKNDIPIDILHGSSYELVIHCAAKVHDINSTSSTLQEHIKINTNGTKKIIALSRRLNSTHFIFLSSCSVYGREGHEVLNETSPVAPKTPYGISKLEAEMLVANAGFKHFTILRPALIYGPNAKGNLEKMMTAIERGNFPPVPDTHNRRSMVCLYDVIRAAVAVATNPAANGQTYILEDGQHYSTRRLYEQMALALGKKPTSLALPLCIFKTLGRFGDLIGKIRGRRFIFDTDAVTKLFSSNVFDGSKITRDLGFSYEWTLEKALPDIVAARTPLS